MTYDIVTDKNLWEGALLFPFALFLWRFKIPTKLSDYKFWKDRNLVAANLSMYEWVSLGVFIAFLVIMLGYTQFGENILLLRVATGSAAPETVRGAGHYLVWVSLFMVFVRFGIFNFLKGGFTMGMFGTAHELGWYLTYFFAKPGNFFLTIYHYGPFIILVLGLVFGWAVLYRDTIPWKSFLFFIGLIGVFDFLWLQAGFPLSIDNVAGYTSDYYNLTVNLVEDLSWVVPAIFLIQPFQLLSVKHKDHSDQGHGNIEEEQSDQGPGEIPHPGVSLSPIDACGAPSTFEIQET